MLVVLAFAFLFGLSAAQRPENASLCDYYAEKLYGSGGNASQAKLVTSIVSLAFGGPPSNFPNVSQDLTGILNPGTFENTPIDLHSWFDGSKASTNLNNAPIGIDWLDGGGIQPLSDFLTGVTDTVVINNTTNEYRLFSHFFVSFSHVFDCSTPIKAPPAAGETGGSQQLSLAYVHKYMDLNHTDLGHFINQLGQSAIHFGFSEQDASVLTGNLNTQYNVRCAPPVVQSPSQPAQLLSLCQDPSCPLAADPDCEPYNDLQPGGVVASSSSSSGSPPSSTSPPSSSTSQPSSSTTSSSASSTSTSPPADKAINSHDSNKLSGGAIAGIAIGSAVVGLMAIALGLFFFKKRTPKASPSEQFSPSSAYVSPAYTDPHASYVSNMHSPMRQAHQNVEHWIGPPPPTAPTPIAEMDSPQYGHSPEMATTSNQWDHIYPPSNPSQR